MSAGYLFIRVYPSRGEPLLEIGSAETRPARISGADASADLPYVADDVSVSDRERAEAALRDALARHSSPEAADRYRLPLETARRILQETAEQLRRVAQFRQRATAEPDNAAAFNNLGCGLDRIGDHAGAIEAFKRATALEPDNALFFANLGCNYGKLGLYRKAIDAFLEAIRLRPDFIKAHFDLGFSYGRLGHHQKAVETFQNAIGINPNVAQLHYNLGHAYVKLGRNREAVKALSAAVRVNPNHANAHYRLGLAHLRARNREAALKQYRILRSLDDAKARRLFRRIYRQYGHGPDARAAQS
jgi:tetratricopeptide (TPR) repeat protein